MFIVPGLEDALLSRMESVGGRILRTNYFPSDPSTDQWEVLVAVEGPTNVDDRFTDDEGLLYIREEKTIMLANVDHEDNAHPAFYAKIKDILDTLMDSTEDSPTGGEGSSSVDRIYETLIALNAGDLRRLILRTEDYKVEAERRVRNLSEFVAPDDFIGMFRGVAQLIDSGAILDFNMRGSEMELVVRYCPPEYEGGEYSVKTAVGLNADGVWYLTASPVLEGMSPAVSCAFHPHASTYHPEVGYSEMCLGNMRGAFNECVTRFDIMGIGFILSQVTSSYNEDDSYHTNLEVAESMNQVEWE